MKFGYALPGLILCLAIAACRHDKDNSNKTARATLNKPAVMPPFRFHERIEVVPGIDYDVLSWGRGTDSLGAYMILCSDSVDRKYTTTNGDLDGAIKDVFNSDLDTDGNPEIFILSQTADSTHYGKVDAYEYNNDNARKLEFPKLSSRQKEGYHGGDSFVIKEDKIIRTYPVYDSDNRNAKLTGEKKILEYSYHGNSFSVKQLSTNSTTTATSTSASTATVRPEPVARHSQQPNDAGNRRHQHHSESHSRVSKHHEISKRRSSAHHRESSKRRRRHRR